MKLRAPLVLKALASQYFGTRVHLDLWVYNGEVPMPSEGMAGRCPCGKTLQFALIQDMMESDFWAAARCDPCSRFHWFKLLRQKPVDVPVEVR